MYVRLLCGLSLLLPIPVATQTSRPTHQHYQMPDGIISPARAACSLRGFRGSFLYVQGHDALGACAAVRQSGREPRLRLQPRRSGPCIRRGGEAGSSCAMAYWDRHSSGPNINGAMTPEDEPKAYELAQKAIAKAAGVTPRERDYISALAKRYTGKPEDRQAADRASADAMRAVHKEYPTDQDAATSMPSR